MSTKLATLENDAHQKLIDIRDGVTAALKLIDKLCAEADSRIEDADKQIERLTDVLVDVERLLTKLQPWLDCMVYPRGEPLPTLPRVDFRALLRDVESIQKQIGELHL